MGNTSVDSVVVYFGWMTASKFLFQVLMLEIHHLLLSSFHGDVNLDNTRIGLIVVGICCSGKFWDISYKGC